MLGIIDARQILSFFFFFVKVIQRESGEKKRESKEGLIKCDENGQSPSFSYSLVSRLVAMFSVRFAWLLAITEWSVIYTQSWFTTPKLGAEFSLRPLVAPERPLSPSPSRPTVICPVTERDMQYLHVLLLTQLYRSARLFNYIYTKAVPHTSSRPRSKLICYAVIMIIIRLMRDIIIRTYYCTRSLWQSVVQR